MSVCPCWVLATRSMRTGLGIDAPAKGKLFYLKENPHVLLSLSSSSTALTKITIKTTVALRFALSIQVKTVSSLN